MARISADKSARAIARYLEKHTLAVPDEAEFPAPNANLRLCVVIPAMAESATIEDVLNSLTRGSGRLDEAEVIVVVNQPATASAEISTDNRKTLQLLRNWPQNALKVVTVDRASPGNAFQPDQASVGRARRIGMDLAVRRMTRVGTTTAGIIACLDGDSPVAPGYVDAIFDAFDTHPGWQAALCHYRHEWPADPRHAAAIAAYELWLRYYESALQLAGTPYAAQTIGSCMVMTAAGYAMADGMPLRAAGEDFYMLRKLVKIAGEGGVGFIPDALVMPSSRPSDRVPFGTGAAVLRMLAEGHARYVFVEPPVLFAQLGAFFERIPRVFRDERPLSASLRVADGPEEPRTALVCEFLEREHGWKPLEKLRRNAPDEARFLRAVHTWFDSLRVVRYGHFGKQILGEIGIFDAIAEILDRRHETCHCDLPRPKIERATGDDFARWLEMMRERKIRSARRPEIHDS